MKKSAALFLVIACLLVGSIVGHVVGYVFYDPKIRGYETASTAPTFNVSGLNPTETSQEAQIIRLLNLLNFGFMVLAASVPVYIIYISLVKHVERRLLLSAVWLVLFILIHSVYHLTEFLGFEFLADTVFLPLGVIFLVIFGVHYARGGI